MQGLMMNWQLTMDKDLEHANRLYPTKRVTTMQPDGSLHRYTYGDMYKRVKRLAKALTQLGVEPGDRIGTFAWNNYQHLELYFAIPGAAAVCHTLNIRLFPEQLAYIINHAEDKIVFIDGTLLPLYEKVAPQATGVQHHVLFNAPREAASRLPNVLFYEDLIEGSRRGLRLALYGREPGHGHVLHLRHHGRTQGRALQPPLDVPPHAGRKPA